MRDSMVFYRSFLDAIEELPAEEFKGAVLAIMKYALDGEEIGVDGAAKVFFKMAKPQVDANNKRYENGSKGGKVKPNSNQTCTKGEPNGNQTDTKCEPNVNDNVNVNGSLKESIKCVRTKHGKYGWVELTDDEFMKLASETKSAIKVANAIKAVDEYVQSNGNKQKYTDWYVVLQKAIKENWGGCNDS